jgi:hypothetical protein
MQAIYSHAEIVAKLQRAHGIRDRIYAMQRKRAEIACREAGIGEINMCSIHNALISLEQGQPWREINYSALRRANRILNDFRAGRIVDNYYRRMVGLPAH